MRSVAALGVAVYLFLAGVPLLVGAGTPAPAAPLYEVPEPGSYELPPIRRVSDHELLGSGGMPERMFPAAGPELSVIAFVYTHCSEARGCPAAFAMLQRLDRELSLRPELVHRVRLVTVSFDPERDTPERMAQLRSRLKPQTGWRFLTARGPRDLRKLLGDFGQSVLEQFSKEGERTGVLQHVLQIFLVDADLAVRNIYSSGLLDPELLLADIRTVLIERDAAQR